MEQKLHQRGRRQYAIVRVLMVLLLAVEAVLAVAAWHWRGGNAAVLLALNAVLLIWCGAKLRQRPSCCR